MAHPDTQSRQETWELDPQHSLVAFSVRHMMISTVHGRFGRVSGIVVMDPSDPTTASADVRIDASSIDSGLAARDDHLRSADFLDVERFPVIAFRTMRVALMSPGKYFVLGQLSIRDVKCDVPLWVESAGTVTDPWGAQRVGFSATTKIKRTDFGLTWNAVLEAGGVAVGDEVTITVEVELLRHTDQRAA